MQKLDFDTFWDKYLLGAFPDWKPTEYDISFWAEKLQTVELAEAKRALKLYYETKQYSKPNWAKYCEFLVKASGKPAYDAKINSGCMYFLVQCFSSKTPSDVGQYKPIACDVSKEQHAKDILNRCDDIRRVYCWQYREDAAHDWVLEAAHQTCAKLSSRETTWLPALNKSFGQVRDEFLACRDHFKVHKINPHLPLECQISMSSIVPDYNRRDDFYGEANATGARSYDNAPAYATTGVNDNGDGMPF